MFKAMFAAFGIVALLAGAVEARDPSLPLDLSIPSALPEQKSIIVQHDNGDVTTGYYNSRTRDLWLSGSHGELTFGHEDAQGNIVIQDYGGDDDD